MSIVNTNNKQCRVSFEESIISSLPEFNGLWFLDNITPLPASFFTKLHKLTFHQLAFTVLKKLISFKISDPQLKTVIKKAFNFPIKIKTLSSNIYILETFHGPTYTFKDFGARFLACYLEEFLKKATTETYNVLVSTSGDTGSAIAAAFNDKKNIKITILYPDNKVSKIQELQMTTFGNNITACSIKNNFDDCQTFVKKAFIDVNLKHLKLISANSINLGRLLPQSLYYFYAYGKIRKQLGFTPKNVIFSVPCGNCGNLTGGLIAKKLGLPVTFIAAQNKNRTLINYLKYGEYKPIKSVTTTSNAMDVGDPSNFKRINFLYPSLDALRKDVTGVYCSENKTIETIKKVWQKYNYIIDPHTAVAYYGMGKRDEGSYYIVVSTSHPMKFRDTIYKTLKTDVKLPEDIKLLFNKKQYKIHIKESYYNFINLLTKKYKCITLIGMPGAGKSAVANYINNNSHFENIEIDELIEKTYNKTLVELIAELGEEKFKQLEETTILNIDSQKKNIISPGGSIIYSELSMKHLSDTLIIYLKCNFETIKRRTANFTNRGIIFNGLSPLELFNERDILYNKYSDIIINAENYTIKNIGDLIINL